MTARKKGQRVVLAAVVLGLLSVGAAAIVSWKDLLEEWHLHRLGSPDREVRVAAIAGLGALRSRQAIPAFLRAAEEDDATVVRALIPASCAIGLDAVPVLARLLKCKDAELAREAADGLAGLEPARQVGEALKDSELRRAFAEALARKGRHAEALAELLDLYDRCDPGNMFTGVESIPIVFSMMALGRDYPPALAALRERRDRLEEKVLGAAGRTSWLGKFLPSPRGMVEASHLVSLNSFMGEPERNLSLFDKAKPLSGGAQLREQLLVGLMDQLLEKRRYADICEASGQQQKQVLNALAAVRFAPLGLAHIPAKDRQELVQQALRTFVETGGKLFEAYAGGGQPRRADAFSERLTAAAPTSHTYSTLVRHALQAGDRERAGALVRRAEEKLPPGDAQAVREALTAPPKPAEEAAEPSE